MPFKKGELRGLFPTWLRASGIGISVGILPGAGGNIAASLSYNTAKNADKNPDSFGRGNPKGVAAAECGNNADNAASMIPALALGIPGNVVAALVLSALVIHGLQPGPQLFQQSPVLVGGFMMEMLLTSLLILCLGGALATRVFAQFQRLPGVLLVPSILILMCVGVYVINGRPVDLWIMLLAGIGKSQCPSRANHSWDDPWAHGRTERPPGASDQPRRRHRTSDTTDLCRVGHCNRVSDLVASLQSAATKKAGP